MTKPTVYVVHGWEERSNFNTILKQMKKKCSDNQTQNGKLTLAFFSSLLQSLLQYYYDLKVFHTSISR